MFFVFKVQILLVVPALANFLNRSPLVAQFDLSSLFLIACGGSSLSSEIENELSEKLNVLVVQVNNSSH